MMRNLRLRSALLVPMWLGSALLGTAALSGCEAVAAGDDFTQAYDSYLNKCASCHAPGAAGATAGIETTLDFSTADAARASLKTGSAAGLTGNQAACNGVPFVVAGKPEQSLLMAVLDENVRQNLDLASHAGCDGTAATDMTIRVGGADADAIAKVRAWITAGAE